MTVFELKSTSWTLTALRLHEADPQRLDAALRARFGDTPGLFDGDPVVLDLALLAAQDGAIDFASIGEVLRRHRLSPLAVQGGSPAQMQAAREQGLAEAMDAGPGGLPLAVAAPPPAAAAAGEAHEAHDAAAAPAAAAAPVEAAGAVATAGAAPVPTVVVDKALRSGQRVYARGGDLVVLAGVSFGAEVIADGNVHVYGPLRGRAIAGARGDTSARIFSTCLEPQLMAIAGIYRAIEVPLASHVWARPAQVRLDGERLQVDPL